MIPRQGDIWWAEAEDKRRPVLIVTRSEAVPVLRTVVVAPITRTIRGIPTEIALNSENGLGVPCVATFDNLQPVPKAYLTSRVGQLTNPRHDICRTLSALADC